MTKLAAPLILLFACNADSPPPASPAETASSPAPAASAPTTTAASAPTPTTTSAVQTSGSLPPVETKCTQDSDCGVVTFGVQENGKCCNACGRESSTAGTKPWVTNVTAACKSYLADSKKFCPQMQCIGGSTRAECKAGACVLKLN